MNTPLFRPTPTPPSNAVPRPDGTWGSGGRLVEYFYELARRRLLS
jgi:hypothetical protein